MLLVSLAPHARAQVDVGAGLGPEALGLGDHKSSHDRPSVLPMALAASLAWDTTTWTRLEISTATSPAEQLTDLIEKGYYRLELLQVVLMADKAGKPLSTITEQREKGKGLRELAQTFGTEYDAIYDRSLEIDRTIEKTLLPSILKLQ